MIKFIFIGIISIMSFQSSEVLIEEKISSEEVPCRISCELTIRDRDGILVTSSASAGGIFTSCTKAREKACAKALAKIKNEN